MKKIISLLLIFAMLIPASVTPLAENEDPIRELFYEITATETGCTVDISADILFSSPEESLDSIQFTLTYDPAQMHFLDVSKDGGALVSDVITSDFFWSVGGPESGTVLFAASSAFGSQTDGLVVSLQFECQNGLPGADTVTVSDALYSTYHKTTGQQVCYSLDAASSPSKDTSISAEEVPVSDPQSIIPEEQSQSGWTRFVRSVFGDSCCAAD